MNLRVFLRRKESSGVSTVFGVVFFKGLYKVVIQPGQLLGILFCLLLQCNLLVSDFKTLGVRCLPQKQRGLEITKEQQNKEKKTFGLSKDKGWKKKLHRHRPQIASTHPKCQKK